MRTLVSRAVDEARAISSGSLITEIPADALDGGFRQRLSGVNRNSHPKRTPLDDPNLPGAGLDFYPAVSNGDLESHAGRDSCLVANRFWKNEATGIIDGSADRVSHGKRFYANPAHRHIHPIRSRRAVTCATWCWPCQA